MSEITSNFLLGVVASGVTCLWFILWNLSDIAASLRVLAGRS